MNTINWKEIFTQKWLFGIDRVLLHRFDKSMFVFGLGLVILGIILKAGSWWYVRNPFLKKILNRLAMLGFVIGFLELLWYGLRFENTRVLGTHFVALLIALAGLTWLFFIAKYLFTQYRRDVEQWKKDQVKQKYLNQSPR